MKNINIWKKLSLASTCFGVIMLYKGVDRMIHYNNSGTYGDPTVNAYVGGDCYNYIINGTHATAFFVLAAMFIISAVGLVGVGYMHDLREMECKKIEKEKNPPTLEDALPPL